MRRDAEHLALARERVAGELVGDERDADAVVAHGLHAGRLAVGRGLLRRVELLGVQPDDPRDPLARQVLLLQPGLDPDPLVVHQDDPPAEVVAVLGADQVGGRAGLLHAGQGEQPLAFGLAELDGDGRLRRQLDGLDLVVRDERAGGHRRAELDAVLVDAGDHRGDDVAAAEVQRPTLLGRRRARRRIGQGLGEPQRHAAHAAGGLSWCRLPVGLRHAVAAAAPGR